MFATTGDSAIGRSRGAALGHWACYALALLLPCAAYWPLGQPAAPDILTIYVTPGVYLSDLAVGAMLLAGLAADRGWSKLGATVRATAGVSVPLLALAGLALLTAPLARAPTLAGYTALRWLIAAGVFLVIAQSDMAFERILMVFLAGLGIQALIGLGQIVTQGPLGLPGEFALAPTRSGAAIIAVGQTHWLRAYGLTLHPNVLGGFMAIGLLMGLPLVNRRGTRLVWWLVWLGLLLSFSRAAWLATALALPPLAGWLAWRQPALRRPLISTVAIAALAALGAGTLLAAQLLVRMHPFAVAEEYRSMSERGEMIALALNVVAARPLIGVGAGNFPLAMRDAGASLSPQFVHNVPLLLAAEVGVAGGALWLWLWLAPGMWLDRHWRALNPWPVVLISAWLALGSICLWDSYPWALNQGCLLTITVLGLMSRALMVHHSNCGGVGS
jgi:hypothetical protein